MTGFVRWWFGCITSVKPDGALKLWPIIAWRIDVGGAGLFDGMRLHVEENIFGFGLTGSEPACACGSRENHRRDRFVADSPQEEAVSSEPVSEKENSERRQIGRFYEDWERFLMPQSAFSLPANPKMVAFLPIVAGPGSAH